MPIAFYSIVCGVCGLPSQVHIYTCTSPAQLPSDVCVYEPCAAHHPDQANVPEGQLPLIVCSLSTPSTASAGSTTPTCSLYMLCHQPSPLCVMLICLSACVCVCVCVCVCLCVYAEEWDFVYVYVIVCVDTGQASGAESSQSG